MSDKLDVELTRIGDFYEAIGNSARVLRDVCGATLAVKRCPERELAGIPRYCLPTYVDRLNKAGHWVVIVPDDAASLAD